MAKVFVKLPARLLAGPVVRLAGAVSVAGCLFMYFASNIQAYDSDGEIKALTAKVDTLRSQKPESMALASELAHLGQAQSRAERLSDAGGSLDQMLLICRSKPGDDKLNLVMALALRADLERHVGHYGNARALLDEAISSCVYHSKRVELARATCLNKLSLVDDAEGHYREGEQHAASAVKIFEVTAPADTKIIAIAKIALADNLRQQGRYIEAQKILLDVDSALQFLLKNQSAKTQDLTLCREAATAKNNLGAVYFWLGDYRQARKIVNDAYALRQQLLPQESEELANSLNDLGAIDQKLGDYESAQRYYEQALARRIKVLGKNHRETALVLGNLGNLQSARKQYKSAADFYRQALDSLKAAKQANHPESGEYLEGLSIALAKLGDYPSSIDAAKKSLAVRLQSFGKDNVDYAKSQLAMSKILAWQNRYIDAEPYAKAASDTMQRRLGAQHPDYKKAQLVLLRIKQRQKP